MKRLALLIALALAGCRDEKCQEQVRELENAADLKRELDAVPGLYRTEPQEQGSLYTCQRFSHGGAPSLEEMRAEKVKLEKAIADSVKRQTREFNKAAGWAK